jgi:hypothetical protein
MYFNVSFKPGDLVTTIAMGFNPWFRPYSIAFPAPNFVPNGKFDENTIF